eukprot:gnl/TRDRNA2_/TRDRNA2_183083_c0_seq1.p1 gnl/TRDRNA2_/TRDRNA2_183083_c0~~gnl/TRDRNA2_/TRDRNA2_183083_c0_seq1.p1  ORF type:complete len:461 (-),score=118.88 gnl/TRDRNA2_/TRDRNA2_183083_c0_seq1:73-1455(-)
MTGRPVSNGTGLQVLLAASAPSTSRGGTSELHRDDDWWMKKPIKEMSISEMEEALQRYEHARRSDERPTRASAAPQTARTLMEDNQRMIDMKRQQKLEQKRQASNFVEKLLAGDREGTDSYKAQVQARKERQAELARYYKETIAIKMDERKNRRTMKIAEGDDITDFPFTNGEHIDENRKLKAAEQREEMRNFLKAQREANPPRRDRLIQDTTEDHTVHYPPIANFGKGRVRAKPPIPESPRAADAAADLASTEVTPFIVGQHPRFLCRPEQHLSRRNQDAHLRAAIEEKATQKKNELDMLKNQLEREAQTREEGLSVEDLKYFDKLRQKAAEQKQNQAFVVRQIEERKQKDLDELKERRSSPCGYYGPQEKAVGSVERVVETHNDLISQMEVNEMRKIDDRNRRLRQERRLADNALAQMSQDREMNAAKQQRHRQVLTTTWNSQLRIRQAFSEVEAIGA